MLRIDIQSNGTEISREVFETYALPVPPNGTDTEINGDLILLFDDEEQAVAYLDELEEHASSLDNDSPAKQPLNVLISAISNDEFVQAYLQ
jgi:hypothetical protein